MKKKKTLIILGVIMALSIGATALWAAYYYSGEGNGVYGDYAPFLGWGGSWSGSTFSGNWQDQVSGVSGTFSSTVVGSSFAGYWYFGSSSTPSGVIAGRITADTVDGRWYAPATQPYSDSGQFWSTTSYFQ